MKGFLQSLPVVGKVFVDIQPDTYNIDPDHLAAAIKQVVTDSKLTPKAVIAVDLFADTPPTYTRASATAICTARALLTVVL